MKTETARHGVKMVLLQETNAGTQLLVNKHAQKHAQTMTDAT